MKRICMVLVGLFVLINLYGQQSIYVNVPVKQFKIEKYTICIGNEDTEVYFSCLAYLETSSNIKVHSICASQQIIEFRSTYRNYDVVRGILNHEFPDMIFFKYDEEIKCE